MQAGKSCQRIKVYFYRPLGRFGARDHFDFS